MIKKVLYSVLAAVIAMGLFGGAIAVSASARTASWVVAVTYQNVGSEASSVYVQFYEEGSSTPIGFDPLNGGTLAPGAGASFFIGNVSGVTDGFRGNAVMSSGQPLVATVVQFSQDAGFRMRLLSNGFQTSDGSDQYLVATTLLNKFSRTSVFSVQNTTGAAVDATIKFYDADNNGNLASTIVHPIAANSSKFIEMDNSTHTGLSGTIFNGSAIVTVPAGSSVVSAVSELYTDRNVAANFEGIPLSRVSNTIYLSTALCDSFNLDTFYAVQNASLTDSATINVYYNDKDGLSVAVDGPYSIGPGQKKSINTCKPSDNTVMNGFTGSARITSTGAPIAVIGKAQCSVSGTCTVDKADVFTAFLGEANGASKLAMPFIRWANYYDFFDPSNTGGYQRSYIAIQNLESSQITVNVKYYDKLGGLVATQPLTIPALAKGNSNADAAGALGKNGMKTDSFGYYTDGSFGGAVVVDAGGNDVIAIVRVQHPGAGEDYNAVPAPSFP